MEVAILCGGLGTRLREETEFRPKPMVNIGNHPILWHVMKIYAHYGYKDFILALGYKGEMIKSYFYNYRWINNDFKINLGQPENVQYYNQTDEDDWRVSLIDTGEKALKGARLKKLEDHIKGEEFMMTYGDSVADIDINKLIEFHRNHGKLATVTGVNSTSRFGELNIEGTRVTSFSEKPPISSQFINGGFFVFKKEIFNYLTKEDNCDLEIGPLEKLAMEGKLQVYKHPKKWACMDTLRDMEYLNKLWAEGKGFWKL